jgi:hypothetical protein
MNDERGTMNEQDRAVVFCFSFIVRRSAFIV